MESESGKWKVKADSESGKWVPQLRKVSLDRKPRRNADSCKIVGKFGVTPVMNSTNPSPGGFRDFGAYKKALELFDLAVADLSPICRNWMCSRLVSQQMGSCDSIAANIEEGYGRGTRREFNRFLIISRGSAQETAGRYHRLRHWIPADVVSDRTRLCGEIIAILTATISTLQRELGNDSPPPHK